MKTIFTFLILIFSLTVMSQNSYKHQWEQADSLEKLGQSQSALDVVINIYDQSKTKGEASDFIKSSLMRMKLESDFQEDYFEKSIERTQAEILTAAEPVKQILHSVLAELYWRYYQNNRWQILDRTETAGFENTDIKTWDLRKLVSKCIENYTLSLENKDFLKSTAISDYNVVLIKTEETRNLRPTLFDFLAHRAIDFYKSSEAGLTKPANTFVPAQAELFAASAEFTSQLLKTNDNFSFEYQALKLYQEVIGLHLYDKNPEALIDAEISRLEYVYSISVNPAKDSLYVAALSGMFSRYKNHPSATEIAFEIAVQLNDDGENSAIYYDTDFEELTAISSAKKWNKKRAVEICDEAISLFPDSFGAENCRIFKARILKPTLSITTNYASAPGKPSLALLTYSNNKTLFFRLLRVDATTDRSLLEMQEEIRFSKYLIMPVEKSWKQELPDAGDYRVHSAEIKIPELKPGHYVLLASNDETFSINSGILNSNSFWISNISYLSSENTEGGNEIRVLNRMDGNPMEGVFVQVFYKEYNSRLRKYETQSGPKYISDENGMLRIPASDNARNGRQYNLLFSHKNDSLIPENSFWSNAYPTGDNQSIVRTHFFTDRGIYRPGQTIFFKGLVVESTGEEVQLKTKFAQEVTFYDVNRQAIAKQTLFTNDFGSYSGSFVAPKDVLTGYMEISCETGSTSIQVEEYKRPKFEVKFEPVRESFKLGQTIIARGKAMAYAGSPVSDAVVSYRVVRETLFPFYWGWRGAVRGEEVEIANGETVTSTDGSFDITFEALADYGIEQDENQFFTFTVTADVTDVNGESHSSTSGISAGYKSLLVKTDVPDEVNLSKSFSFKLLTTNLNNEKQPANGSFKISQLVTPDRVYFDRKWARPDTFVMSKASFEKDFPGEVYNNENDVTTWPVKSEIFSTTFATPADSAFTINDLKEPGMYVLEFKTTDIFGEAVTYKKYFRAYDAKPGSVNTISPVSFTLLQQKAEPGETIQFILGTSLKKVNVQYEIVSKDKIVQRETLVLNREQKLISVPVKEEYRGNFAINVSLVINNRAFVFDRLITVPHTDKDLDISFSTFRNKLLPGQDEEWQITIRDHKGEPAAAEMLAGMYDASLDEFAVNHWYLNIYKYYYRTFGWSANQCFGTGNGRILYHPDNTGYPRSHTYDQLNWFGYSWGNSGRMLRSAMPAAMANEKSSMESEDMVFDSEMTVDKMESKSVTDYSVAEITKPAAGNNATPVQIRKDFNETAFFFPQLATNENGEIVLKFKAPEALTRWKMMGLAHSRDLKTAQVEKMLVTQKDLMVFTNVPRFLREGDTIAFAAKISNISNSDLSVTAEIHFFDAISMQPVDEKVGLIQPTKSFEVQKGSGCAVSWKINIPEGLQAVVYRITAVSGSYSDGEEAAIPVLTNRMLVTESLPLPIKGMQQKNFSFEKLLKSGNAGSTLRNYRLTLEYTSNPAWYAVQALPYLMEYPYECAEQLFSRYYANSLATHIANSDPKIKRVFESWKNTPGESLKSNLEKNEELKSVLLQESPWVREATNESERKQRIGLLFDLNRMAAEQASALKKLKEMQSVNGGWPWFAGMPESRYITQHIVTGLGHLMHLNVINEVENAELNDMLSKAIHFLDVEMKVDFEKSKITDKDYQKNNHLSYEHIQYLYGRSYFTDIYPVTAENTEMIAYFKAQSKKYWKEQNNYMKGMMALYLNRLDEKQAASLIMRSLRETALHNDEMGMYWRNEQRGWYWYQAPVETQALLIEAFDEVAQDTKAVEEMQIWLLKQKQNQDWKTTKATTEAVYALLLRGSALLAEDKPVEIKVGDQIIDAQKTDAAKPEAGTGYFKTSWETTAIKPEMGAVSVKNPNSSIAWGAMYWQYFEQLDKITPAQTPLSLSKKLFRETNTPTGIVIEPVTENTLVKTGDKIVVRIELRSDRDMEYLHLKDMRASAFEPGNVVSGYRYQGGLGYYESIRDASANFFIYYLQKGTYVFEYKLTATQKGDFSNGITTIQSMYAPEFTSHSEGIRVKVE